MKKALLVLLIAAGPASFARERETAPPEDAIEMILVDGGTFTMGCEDGGTPTMECEWESVCEANEKPARKVTVDDFFLAKYETTQRLWASVMGGNPSKFVGENLPVERVSWDDAQGFIRKLNAKTGRQYRLPTEAEWEYAARGGDQSENYPYSGGYFPGGAEAGVGWYEENSGYKTHPVGSQKPNELGFHDMSGNVWEWTGDYYGGYPPGPQANPAGPQTGGNRVIRGGSWIGDAAGVRVFARSGDPPDNRVGTTGFRLAMSVPAPDPAALNVDMVFVSGGMLTGENGDAAVDGFHIAKYEVTQGLWKAVMRNDNPSGFAGNDSLPVEKVSWNDVQRFIKRLNAKTGKEYRLPGAEEWEFAARGGNESRGYEYSGGNGIDSVAWHAGNSGAKTHAVGTKRANELGIHDMSGNVREWTADLHCDSGDRVVRGGGWGRAAKDCRVSRIDDNSVGTRGNGLGFRLARDAAPAKRAGETRPIPKAVTNRILADMVFVSGGAFTMGCTGEQGKACRSDERPAREVTVGGFYICRYELTQAQWKAVTGNNRSMFKGDDRPVEKVSWDDVQEFIRELNARMGRKYRLPTEAEWEYAARGGGGSRGYRYSGGDDIGAVAWYGGNSGAETHPVGGKQPNELGLYDLSGNVDEFVNDWYGDYRLWQRKDPEGASFGKGRVKRGGDWGDGAQYCRVSYRWYGKPFDRGAATGFRLAHD